MEVKINVRESKFVRYKMLQNAWGGGKTRTTMPIFVATFRYGLGTNSLTTISIFFKHLSKEEYLSTY